MQYIHAKMGLVFNLYPVVSAKVDESSVITKEELSNEVEESL
jgi:hypothetical protein